MTDARTAPAAHRGAASRMRRASTAVALAASALLVTSCAAPDEPAAAAFDLRVGALTTQNVLTLCQASGGLDAPLAAAGGTASASEPFALFAPAAEALAADRIDVSSSGATGVLTALEGNSDLVIFAVERGANDTQGIVAGADTGIRDVSDLAGRTVAINQGGTGEYLLRRALEGEGLALEDVEPVYLAPADAAAAFGAGHVDAWATWDQYLVGSQLDLGAQLVATAADIDAHNPSVHVVSRAFLEAHPEAVRAAYDALADCAENMADDPGIVADAYRDAGASDAVAEAIASGTQPEIVPADEAFAAEFADLADFYAAQGMSEPLIDTSPATVDATTLGD